MRRAWQHGLVAFALGCAVAPALADRPFLATDSAAAEEDDDNVWSVESWLARRGRVRSGSIAPEYAFNPTTSVQLELSRSRDRAMRETEYEAEL
jgi:hypothetical protein